MKIDQLDRAILKLLRVRARESYANIGREVGLTAPAIAQRIQRMEEGGIIKGYEAIVDESLLGNDLSVMISVRLRPGGIKQLETAISSLPEIRQCYRITGEDCVMLQAVFQNNAHLVKFIEQISDYGTTNTSIILKDVLHGSGKA